ncbi:MAG TPA: EpsI family protein, partial [Rhodocyclaceae bacterium]|nr:EpsI family protein [Rhodocyclaceae bacterium]
ILFPLAFLLLAVPFGDFMMPILMDWTAKFTVLGLRLTGIPVYQEGLHFVIPSGNWSVVEACSGVRYLIASFTVGTLFAYLNYTSLKRRLIFMGVAIIVPVIANWMRAYLIVMLGHVSGNKLAAGVDHLIYGWVFFGLVIMVMFMIGARWAEDPPSLSDEAAGTDSAAIPAAPRLGLAALVLALSIALPHGVNAVIEHVERAAPPVLQLASESRAGSWKSDDKALADWQPAFQNPAAILNASFHDGDNAVGLYLGYYRGQSYDSKLVSSENVLVRSQDALWARAASGVARVELIQPELQVRTAELRPAGSLEGRSDQRLLVWQVYWINGRLMSSDILAKAYSAVLRLLGQGDDAAVIILYAPKDQPGGGEAALQRFAREHGAQILSTLEQTKARR